MPPKLRQTRIALISCSKAKNQDPAPIRAADRYQASTLFSLSYRYAKEIWKADKIYILSAKYGIIHEDELIENYELSLNHLSMHERKAWARPVRDRLHEMACHGGRAILVLAGTSYYKDLRLDFLRPHNHLSFPLAGLGMGKRMQWLRREIDKAV